ncbi:MAG: endonuclease domain-containing protein [Deltaproteobacteria bacterium]|nr:endonuclease domain-containing protein [Deltaproteobacteria bacterium]
MIKRFRENSPFNLWKKFKQESRRMRVAPTLAEDILWQKIRNNQLGFRFRRQHAIDRFIVDFVCLSKCLVVEVDGLAHRQRQTQDQQRDSSLQNLGFQVVRFTNEQILQEPDWVIDRLKKYLLVD